jgi:hypothetical protein
MKRFLLRRKPKMIPSSVNRTVLSEKRFLIRGLIAKKIITKGIIFRKVEVSASTAVKIYQIAYANAASDRRITNHLTKGLNR